MKKILLTSVFALALNSLSAQNETVETKNNDFNHWSLELAGGFNKPQNHVTPGYSLEVISPYTVDFGVRYMFNNKFGLKLDAGYNHFSEKKGTTPFDGRYYRADIQGVANLGRIMNFETWTNTIGLLAHTGFGVGKVEAENVDDIFVPNFMAGVTGQIRLSNHFALTGDFTTILNARQNVNFDGQGVSAGGGFNSILFNGTVGITYYIGKSEKHADWVQIKDKDVILLESRVAELEAMNVDTDKDGVVDYLDEEPNSAANAMVDTKGRTIVEKEVVKSDTTNNLDSETIKNLVNDGYVSVFFDFNKTTPTADSTESISYVLTYLRNNPSATVDIIGHADEIGSTDYNNKLSEQRANTIKDILLKANVAESRLNVVASGEDTSVDKDSDHARKLVRKVTFLIK